MKDLFREIKQQFIGFPFLLTFCMFLSMFTYGITLRLLFDNKIQMNLNIGMFLTLSTLFLLRSVYVEFKRLFIKIKN